MPMPKSWLDVRQYLIDNLKIEKPQRVITRKDFDSLCESYKVSKKSVPLLFKYLHHSGYLYAHEHLKDNIIIDQRWALKAIYKPLDREQEDYSLFKDLKGKIRVSILFKSFGENYSEEDKWLFLDFMKSCRLCFQFNNNPIWKSNSENDIYVFPRFLPESKPGDITNTWSEIKEVRKFWYYLPWLNYFVIQSFIVALGRKTQTENIWRNGISVSTDDGLFMVEIDYSKCALVLSIQEKAIDKWLKPIFEELKLDKAGGKWQIEDKNGNMIPFDFISWQEEKRKQIERKSGLPMSMDVEQEVSNVEGLDKIPEREQVLDREVLLFIAANPTEDYIHSRTEHSQIIENTYSVKDKIELLEPIFGGNIQILNKKIDSGRPTIIHFVGHGDIEKGLYFHSDDMQSRVEVSAESLGKIFNLIKESHSQLKLVFLNACESKVPAEKISCCGIYAIGFNNEVNSIPARLFSSGFYYKYASTVNVEESMKYGLVQALTKDPDFDKKLKVFI